MGWIKFSCFSEHADRGGVRDQGFSLISFTGLYAKVSPQPFASGLR